MFMTMIFLFIGVVIVIAGGVLFYSGLPGTSGYDHRLGERPASPTRAGRMIGGVLAVLLGIFVCLFSFGWTQVESGEVGVISSFGKVQDEEMQPGLQWRVPVISSVQTWNTKVQTYTFENIEAFTSENQPALLSGIVNYHIEPDAASDLQQGVGADYAAKLIAPQADSALKQKARSYTVDTITSSRDQLALAAVDALEATAGAYRIVIDSVAIRNIDLSKDYLDSVVAKQKAQQDVERTKAEANSAREKARGQADAQVIAAQGQADANNLITASLSDPLIQWEYVKKLAPNVSVMMVPSGAEFIYPLPVSSPAP
jgi:regulator of protease activity HflC (stomatin/prohibitin superfamily)